jgi:UDP-3-O-acyl N-acetylglucosamine deacetylase
MDGANVHTVSYRSQQTLAAAVEVRGVGYVTGADVILRFVPAPPDTGVVFVRTDLSPVVRIPARIDQVTGTQRRTTLGQGPGQVCLVEHVLAALAGLHVDNCFVELNAPEPPGLDGSCLAFIWALEEAGFRRQAARREIVAVAEAVHVAAGDATLAFHPPEAPGLKLTYFLDYGVAAEIPRQVHTQALSPAGFAHDIAPCRTFILEREVEELRRLGIGKRHSASDLLVFGPRGPIQNRLRFANEPARHKVLDMIGDLALLNVDLAGHVVACRSGHPLNIELARKLQEQLRARRPEPCAA